MHIHIVQSPTHLHGLFDHGVFLNVRFKLFLERLQSDHSWFIQCVFKLGNFLRQRCGVKV